MRRLLLPLLSLLAVLVWTSTYYIDYEYLGFIASRKWHGQSIDSCLDLPEKYWMRIPACWDRPLPEHGGTAHGDQKV